MSTQYNTHPHTRVYKKMSVPEPIPSWATTLVPIPYDPMGIQVLVPALITRTLTMKRQ